MYKEKNAMRYKISCEALPTGWSLTPWWTVDRGNPVFGTPVTAGAVEAFMEGYNMRFHELQWGFILVNDGTATAPAVILDVAPEIDPLTDEVDLHPGES